MKPQLTQSDLEQLSAFIDGELDETAAELVRARLSRDETWRSTLTAMRAVDEALGAYQPPAPPPDLAGRIYRNVCQAAARWAARRRLSRWAGAIVATAAAIVIGGLMLPSPRTVDDGRDIAAQDAQVQERLSLNEAEETLDGLDDQDRFVVEHLPFFADYDILDGQDVVLASDVDEAPTPSTGSGSIAVQATLKSRLVRLSEGTLVTAINHNRHEWESLSVEQREHFRRSALAFEQKTPRQRAELLKRYESLMNMPYEKQQAYRERAEWLTAVVDSFTPQERHELSKLMPHERTRRLLERRQLLISQGKLKAKAPSSTKPARP